ncbi:hypothetical protein AB0I35_09535 [Nocardia sp. NPDC050378]|uniref:DUF7373 family lipoprotein n=1 Tax=Nocardia sp. NPDC050378 TaxID=3155400 RepID=UPI0033FB01CB
MKASSLATAAVLLLATTAGCSSDSTENAMASIDLKALETGNYQSVPRNADEAKVDNTGAAIEAIRLGAHVPIPYDADPSYAFLSSTSSPRVTPAIPASLSSVDKERFRELTPGLIAGWTTDGHRRQNSAAGLQAFLRAFSFSTPAEAEVAKNNLVAEQVPKSDSIKSETMSIPGHPTAHTQLRAMDYDSWMAHGSMLFGVRVVDLVSIPRDPTRPIEFISKAYAKLIEMTAGYTPTPVADRPGLAIDVDGMLSRTLPGTKDNWSDGFPDGAVEPLQAALAHEHRPKDAKPALVNAGVDLVSREADTRVYRAKDSKAASALMDALLAPIGQYLSPIESPAGLPVAKCFKEKDKHVPYYLQTNVCYVAFDRYLAVIEAPSAPELLQRTAAQYTLLAVNR